MYFWVYLNLGTTVGCRNSKCQLVTPTRIKQSVVFHMFWTYSFFFSWAVFNPPPAVYYFWGLHYPIYWGLSSSMRWVPIVSNQFDTIHDGFSRDSRVTHHQKILSSITIRNSMNQPVPVEGAVKNQYGQSSDCSWCDWWLSNSINPIIIPLSFSHWIGLRNKYRKSLYLMVKTMGFRFRFSHQKSNSLNQWFELVMVLRHFAHLLGRSLAEAMLDEECIVPNGSDQGGSGPGVSSRISLVGSRHFFHWIGLRENRNRKPWFLPSNIGLSG